jgi:hypothetical protein
MPTADDKTVQDAPRETTDPDFPPAPGAAPRSKGATLKMAALSIEAAPSESRDAGEATTITGQEPERTDPGLPEHSVIATADTEPSPLPPMGGPVKPVDHDLLLQALSSYRRPDRPVVEAAASDGAAAARYAGVVHDPVAATRTPDPLPLIVVERTLPPLPPREDLSARSAAPAEEVRPATPPQFPVPYPTPPERHPDSWNITAPPERSRRGWILGAVLGVVAVAVLVTAVGLGLLRAQASSGPAASDTTAGPRASAAPAAATTLPPPLPSAVAAPVPVPAPLAAASTAVQEAAPAPVPTRIPTAVVQPRSPATASPSPSTRQSTASPGAVPPRTDVIRSL